MRGFSSAVPYLRSLCLRADIIALSEHWLHENKIGRLKEISEDFLYCARSSKSASSENYGSKRGQGGVAVLWNSKLGGVSQISDIIHDRMCGIRIQTRTNLVLNIISIYLPSQGSPDSYSACIDDLSEFVTSREIGSKTIICGDANGDMGNLAGNRSVKMPTQRGKELFEFISSHNLRAINSMDMCKGPIITHTGPTGSSTIDYIMTPAELIDHVAGCEVLKEECLNCSDHNPIILNLRIDTLVPTTVESNPVRMPKWHKVSNADMVTLYTNVVERDLQDVLTFVGQITAPDEIDDAFSRIVSTLKSASRAIPTSKYRPNLKPFWSPELTDLKTKKVSKFRAWVATGRPRTPDAITWVEHKLAKKEFARALRRISKEYENRVMVEAIESSTTDKSVFWQHLKKCRGPTGCKVLAIKDANDKVVYEIKDILNIWKGHFSKLSTPKEDPKFDQDHFEQVNEKIEGLNKGVDGSIFTDVPISTREVQKAIDKLKKKKSCGFDGISAEHVKYGGVLLVITITFIFNLIWKMEYIPVNFRRGVQIPLFKGKNLCSTDTNNYRGITLLSIFSKIFELVIWSRIEPWWKECESLSKYQGACRKGQSCLHTSLLLQETVANALETNSKVIVSYFDVSKAFDTVWINGLFVKLHDMGIKGKLWRLMYRTYSDFLCRVRIAGSFSEWYPMSCGIHQGGILSLNKYLVFINGLLIELENSKLCCKISNIPSSPAGYADDLATATVSKFRTDQVHNIVNRYGMKWRFNFNAGKSAVLVFGEDRKSSILNRKSRVFRLGHEGVKEKESYDHVGVKMGIFSDCTARVEEKISKGRKSLNASSGLGIRKNGLNMGTCNLIFWQVVVPTVTFGCEVWICSEKDEELLLNFQRYAGKKVQRFPPRAPNASSFYGLGWMKLTAYVRVKKLLFIMSIVRMHPENILVKILRKRLTEFDQNTDECRKNKFRSPIFDILSVTITFGLYNVVKDMIMNGLPAVTKRSWSKLVWERAWALENVNWRATNIILKENDLLTNTIGNSRYLTWWKIGDLDYRLAKMCESMSKIVCHASLLKTDDYRLKGLNMSNRTCIRCDQYCIEDITHIIMQCPGYNDERILMFNEIYDECPNARGVFESNSGNILYYLLGRDIPTLDDNEMFSLWCISGKMITQMYRKATHDRIGVG